MVVVLSMAQVVTHNDPHWQVEQCMVHDDTVKHPQKKWPRRGVIMHIEVPCSILNIYTLPASITIHPPPSTAGAVPSLP